MSKSTIPANDPKLKRTDMVLAFLTALRSHNSNIFAHSARIAHDYGIRNVPDVIMKLRREGWDIRTLTAMDVVYRGHVYPRMAAYFLAGSATLPWHTR